MVFTFDDSHMIIIMEWRSFSVLHCLLYGMSVADDGKIPTFNDILSRIWSHALLVRHPELLINELYRIRKNKNKAILPFEPHPEKTCVFFFLFFVFCLYKILNKGADQLRGNQYQHL